MARDQMQPSRQRLGIANAPIALRAVSAGLMIVAANARADDGVEFFERKIRPVLVKHCYACHSQSAAAKKTLKGNLRLDSRKAIREGGDSGPAIVPGKPKDSLLLSALRHKSFKMPPKEKLPDKVIADFARWIEIGAPDPRDGQTKTSDAVDVESARQTWVFQPPKAPQQPMVKDQRWPRNAVDLLVLSKLEANGLRPAPPADKRTLIRRAAYDLLGLPPTPDEIKSILADDSPEAFAHAVDRFLDSPDFGIRWTRHWLDNVRYSLDDPTCAANSNGSFSIAPYRDWVVKSFNQDLPYDQFVRMQVAGDLMPNDDPKYINADALTATGIWGLAHLIEGNDKEKVVADFVDEQLDVLGRTFLGLTISCARCHDHKFDPIAQNDYYALAGIFYSSHIFRFRGTSARLRDRLQRPILHSKAEQTEFESKQKRLKKLDVDIAAIEKKHSKAIELQKSRRDLKAQLERKPKSDDEKKQIEKSIQEFRKKESDLLADQKKNGWDAEPKELQQHAQLVPERDRLKQEVAAVPLRMVMQDGPIPKTRHKSIGDLAVFLRGDHLSLGKTVARGIPRVFTSKSDEKSKTDGSGRLQLARWLTRSDNPLTARVMVNRVWQHIMGSGIVATPSNFGKLGQTPTHPKLLDHLAVRFVKNGWSIKSLIREIMVSRTYQQSSVTRREDAARDPENRWFGRMNRKRLDAEALKDALFWHDGQLRRCEFAMPRYQKRALYGEFSRDKPQSMLDLFDGADPDLLVPRRADSTSAPQALFMLNHELVQSTARTVVRRIYDQSKDDRERVSKIYQQLFGRPVSETEMQTALELIQQFRETRKKLQAEDKSIDIEMGPCIDLSLALICSNEFLYVD